MSPYNYCGNDPVNRFDPDGKDPYRIKEYYSKYVVSATVYTNKDSYTSAIQARDFWNKRSSDSYNGKKIEYNITVTSKNNGEFSILQGESGYQANPDVNTYEVNDNEVAKHNSENKKEGKGDATGFRNPKTGNIYVSSAYAMNLPNSDKQSTTGAHEFGHIIGMQHSPTGIMTVSQNKHRDASVTTDNIQQMMTNTEVQKNFWVIIANLFNRPSK